MAGALAVSPSTPDPVDERDEATEASAPSHPNGSTTTIPSGQNVLLRRFLLRSIKNDDVEAFDSVVEADVDVNQDFEGVWLLYYAAQNGGPKVTTALLERGANIEAVTSSGRTPLMQAAESNTAEVVELLLVWGADPNVQLDSSGALTALHLASFSDQAESVAVLLRYGADPEIEGDNGLTALMYAMYWDDIDTITALLDGGASVDHRNNFGSTAADLAQSDQAAALVADARA